MDDQGPPKNFKQMRIDRPILEEEIEEDSDSIEAIKVQNSVNETSEHTSSKKFSIAGFGDAIDPQTSIGTLSPSNSLHPIQAVQPMMINSPSAISFSTVLSASPPHTPNPYSKKFRLRFNIDDDNQSVSTLDGPRRMKSILSERDLLRLKSLKSARRHNRDKKTIVLKEEEEEEEEVEEPKADEDMVAANAIHHEEKQPVDWIDSKEARGGFVQYFCFIYALLAIFYLVVEEATDENVTDYFPAGIIFHYYMYSVAILFIVYVNLFVIHPPWLNRILYFLADKGWWKNAEKHIIMPASHNAEPVSTLYLRMGTLLFGCAGVVLYGLELYMLFAGKVPVSFVPMAVAENILGIVFTFSQMYFMNVNFKLLVQTSQNICRFGFMHCFALNLWIWYRFAAAKTHKSKKKQITKEQKKKAAYAANASKEKAADIASLATSSEGSSEGSSEEFLLSNGTTGNRTVDTANDILTRVVDYMTTTLSPVRSTTMRPSTYLITTTLASTNSTMVEEVQERSTVASLEYFGDFAGFLNTCLIEYSLIGAAVMFVFWTHLDPSVPQHLHEKKRGVRVDFTASLTGLYLGVVIFILGAVICGVYAALYGDCNDYAYLLLGIYECVCFSCCIIAVIAATIFMRSLTLAGHRHGEDVDFLLLYVAFCGEVIWCSAELARFIDVGGDGFIFAVTLVRLAHVFSQTWFILMACKLELSSCTKITAMRGRQCVTFMLVTNVTLFFFHIYESMTEGFGYISASSSNHTYVKLLAGPIIAFYRFHCSVCLAEVWKKTFSRPKAHHSHHSVEEGGHSMATSPVSPMTPFEGHALVNGGH